MPQSRKQSAFEVTANVATGFILSLIIQTAVYPIYGFHVTASANVQLTCIFTVASLIRGYVWRRIFNRKARPIGVQ